MNIGQILTDILVFLSSTTGNLGWGIILFTAAARIILMPFTMSSLRAGKKMREVQPELKKLKKLHGKDKQALQKAQLDLYKRYNINPLAGCIPQLIQFGLVIVMYQALIGYLKDPTIVNGAASVQFLWFDLRNPDSLYIVPVLAGVSQMIFSLMIAPGAETRDIVPNASKKKEVLVENKKEEDMAEMAASMQQQMLFIMPVMTGILALQFPSGLGLYWIVSTILGIVQQYYVSGWGGLVVYTTRVITWLRTRSQVLKS